MREAAFLDALEEACKDALDTFFSRVRDVFRVPWVLWEGVRDGGPSLIGTVRSKNSETVGEGVAGCSWGPDEVVPGGLSD